MDVDIEREVVVERDNAESAAAEVLIVFKYVVVEPCVPIILRVQVAAILKLQEYLRDSTTYLRPVLRIDLNDLIQRLRPEFPDTVQGLLRVGETG